MAHHAQPGLTLRLARALVGMYPSSWRERYGEEMLMILEESHPTWRTVLNLGVNLCDAHLHREYVQGSKFSMLQKIRFNQLILYCSAILFFTVWFFAVRSSPYAMYVYNEMHYTLSPVLATLTNFYVLFLLLLILAGGFPLLLAAYWNGLKTKNLKALFLCSIGLLSPVTAAYFSGYALGYLEAIPILHGSTATWLTLGIIFAGLYVGLSLLFLGVHLVVPSRRITYAGLYLSVAIPFFMLIGLVLLLIHISPFVHAVLTLGGADYYLIRQGIFLFMMVAMLAFALFSLKNAFQAKRMVQAETRQHEAMTM